MYDPETASLLRSAPELPNLNSKDLPRLLTNHYAQIVSIRLGGTQQLDAQDEWSLEKIADAYELIVSVTDEPSIRRPSAFVAASAQLILSRRQEFFSGTNVLIVNISRDFLSPKLAAILLFLSAEQFADAHEAASQISNSPPNQHTLDAVITSHIIDLAQGNLSNIISRGKVRERLSFPLKPNEETATLAMLHFLANGIELIANRALGQLTLTGEIHSPEFFFNKVKTLSSATINGIENPRIECCYPGIYHLASLLITACDGISESSLTSLAAPSNETTEFWNKWILFRANKFPYIWPNHRKAIQQSFHFTGISAVMVLPTGAGKTTVSSLKIANTLSQGKKVIFLAPTHALVDQLTKDLQEMFPQEILGSSVSSDFDLLFQKNTVLPEVEVMTPERCLAMISFSPDSFKDVGLLVFDECHLLSPESGKIRRSLDSMLCLLAFNKIVQNADMLFLSAMLKNGEEFADWISQLTGRKCLSVDLLWKPSRQARGVVVYRDREVNAIKNNARNIQSQLNDEKENKAKSLRKGAERALIVEPYVIWGLQHNWLDLASNSAACTFTKLLNKKVNLSGGLSGSGVFIKPNVNGVSAKIAELSAKNSLKTIIFVNQKSHTISLSNTISQSFETKIEPAHDEAIRWEALELELGDLKHSLLTKGNLAVPHNASMLPLERDLSERMYKRENGALVIVATPTLAQGLNLPAQLAILAGDKRAGVINNEREPLAVHELLNAAARAGRAGHLANGIVLLVPEPVLSFPEEQSLDSQVLEKLQALIPEDDRCVEITDPLGIVLDRISENNIADDDVVYVVNRLSTLSDSESEDNSLFNLRKSFAAYKLKQRDEEHLFDEQLVRLTYLVEQEDSEDIDEPLRVLASQSGLPPAILFRLKNVIKKGIGNLPCTIWEWVTWLISWLNLEPEARSLLLSDVKSSILGATGNKKDGEITEEVLNALTQGIYAYISGLPLRDVESALGGDPDSSNQTKKTCPRMRELVGSVLPRGFSFVMGLITRLITEIDPYDAQENLSSDVVESLSAAIRLGYDTPEKMRLSHANSSFLSRVAVHKAFLVENGFSG